MNDRRWYAFNGLDTVKKHLSEVKTLADLMQMRSDIHGSGTNLTYFVEGTPGVYCVDCVAGEDSYRHVFMTAEARDRFGELKPGEGDALTVLES